MSSFSKWIWNTSLRNVTGKLPVRMKSILLSQGIRTSDVQLFILLENKCGMFFPQTTQGKHFHWPIMEYNFSNSHLLQENFCKRYIITVNCIYFHRSVSVDERWSVQYIPKVSKCTHAVWPQIWNVNIISIPRKQVGIFEVCHIFIFNPCLTTCCVSQRLPTSSHHLMRHNKIFHLLQKVPLSCRTRDMHGDCETYSSDCKSMLSCREVGNKESFRVFIDLVKYEWRDNDTKLCIIHCLHGAGGARGNVCRRRHGTAHVCGWLFFINLADLFCLL